MGAVWLIGRNWINVNRLLSFLQLSIEATRVAAFSTREKGGISERQGERDR